MWLNSLTNERSAILQYMSLVPQGTSFLRSPTTQELRSRSLRASSGERLVSAQTIMPNNASQQLACQLICPSLQSVVSEHLLMNYIPTSPEAGELRKTGANNIFDQRWSMLVQQILQQNNGPGNEQDGFVAWSKDGFVRFQNRSIPSELAKRYAEISLITGIEIERLKITNAYEQSDMAGKTEFADKFDAALQNFVQNPAAGFKVDGGGVVYSVTQNTSGGVSFFRYKKQNWFQKTLSTLCGWVKPVMKGLSWIFPSLKTLAKPLEWVASGISALLSFSQTQSVEKEARKAGGFQN